LIILAHLVLFVFAVAPFTNIIDLLLVLFSLILVYFIIVSISLGVPPRMSSDCEGSGNFAFLHHISRHGIGTFYFRMNS